MGRAQSDISGVTNFHEPIRAKQRFSRNESSCAIMCNCFYQLPVMSVKSDQTTPAQLLIQQTLSVKLLLNLFLNFYFVTFLLVARILMKLGGKV